MTSGDALYWDPYDSRFAADPWPVFSRISEEAPLYCNEIHDFYALSRFADVERALTDTDTFSSSPGVILELIKTFCVRCLDPLVGQKRFDLIETLCVGTARSPFREQSGSKMVTEDGGKIDFSSEVVISHDVRGWERLPLVVG